MSWEYIKCSPGLWGGLGAGMRLGLWVLRMTNIKDPCGESWEVWLAKKRVGTTWLGALAAHAEEMRGHRRFLSKEVTQPMLSSWRPIWQHCGAGQDRAAGVWRQQDSSVYHFPQWAVATCNSLTGGWLQMRRADSIQYVLDYRLWNTLWKKKRSIKSSPHCLAWHLQLSVNCPH